MCLTLFGKMALTGFARRQITLSSRPHCASGLPFEPFSMCGRVVAGTTPMPAAGRPLARTASLHLPALWGSPTCFHSQGCPCATHSTGSTPRRWLQPTSTPSLMAGRSKGWYAMQQRSESRGVGLRTEPSQATEPSSERARALGAVPVALGDRTSERTSCFQSPMR